MVLGSSDWNSHVRVPRPSHWFPPNGHVPDTQLSLPSVMVSRWPLKDTVSVLPVREMEPAGITPAVSTAKLSARNVVRIDSPPKFRSSPGIHWEPDPNLPGHSIHGSGSEMNRLASTGVPEIPMPRLIPTSINLFLRALALNRLDQTRSGLC